MASGAKIILSKLPVGDLATQFFADRNLFCAGRVAQDDMARVAKVNKQTNKRINTIKQQMKSEWARVIYIAPSSSVAAQVTINNLSITLGNY